MPNLTIAAIIRRAGGPTIISKRLAEIDAARLLEDPSYVPELSIAPSAVSKWEHLGNIPIKYWPHLVEMAADLRPLTSDDLLAAHTVAK